MKKIEVIVLAQADFDRHMEANNITRSNVGERDDVFFISINYTGDFIKIPYFVESGKNVCVLYFDDVDGDTGGQNPMTEHQGRELIQFLLEQQVQGKTMCIVHCTAGISRSGAIGAFVNDLFGGSYASFVKRNPQIQPNAYVSALLNRLYREEYLEG